MIHQKVEYVKINFVEFGFMDLSLFFLIFSFHVSVTGMDINGHRRFPAVLIECVAAGCYNLVVEVLPYNMSGQNL